MVIINNQYIQHIRQGPEEDIRQYKLRVRLPSGPPLKQKRLPRKRWPFLFSVRNVTYGREPPSTNRLPRRFGQTLGCPEGVRKPLRVFESIPFFPQQNKTRKTSFTRGSLFYFQFGLSVWTRTPSTNRPPGRFGQPSGCPAGVKKPIRAFESLIVLQDDLDSLQTAPQG